MSVLVVSGTGTGVGKTVVTAALAALARRRGAAVAVVKPAQTGVAPGEPGDLADVRRLAGVDDLHEPARYPDPLSPAAAARLAGLPPLALPDAVRAIRELAETRRLVLVEGAGGLLVRYDDDGATIADLARALGAPVLVVTRAGLGTLNETALTLEALAHRGLPLAGVVVGAWPAQPDLAARSNVRDLETLAAQPLSGALAEGAGALDPSAFADAAAAGLAPAFGGRFDAADFRRAHDPLSRTRPDQRPTREAGTVTDTLDGTTNRTDILAVARRQVLEEGRGLTTYQALACLTLPDDRLDELLALAHEVRMAWCGPEVEVEGIVSVKTGGCPEDCHFCSQSGQFSSPVRAAWIDVPELVRAARETRATGATEFCIVAAVRGPDARLMDAVRRGIEAIRADGNDVNIACSLGMLTREQVDELVAMDVHRYNHNLETARSRFPEIVTTHSWEERWDTCRMVRAAGMELCCGGIVGMGETVEQRAEFAGQLGELAPDEVPLNFLNPRPGTPFADFPVVEAREALRVIATFRLALPRTILRYAGGREITLGDLGTRHGMLGGINAVIVGNYLTTLGRSPDTDLAMLDELRMPIKALSQTL